MTGNKTLLKSTSVLGLVFALAQPASAMTCVEYNQLDAGAQKEAFETMGGRENLREEAVGADEGEKAEELSETNELGDPDAQNGGRAAARAAATGSDEELMVVLKEECSTYPDMSFDAMFKESEAK